MNHPVILAVPGLMLLDYLLTIVAARASLGVYRQHYSTPHFELNPLWQKSVEQLRWFSPRFFTALCGLTALLVLFDRQQSFPSWFVGMLVGGYGASLGRHLSSLLLFHYLNRHPAEIAGRVHLTHSLVLKVSMFNTLGLAPLLGLIAVLVPEPQVIGALVGVLALAFAHLGWARQAKSQAVKTLEPVDAHAHSELSMETMPSSKGETLS
jgi:hypothetical protein